MHWLIGKEDPQPPPPPEKPRARPWRLWTDLDRYGPGALTIHSTYGTREAAERARDKYLREHGGKAAVTHRDDG